MHRIIVLWQDDGHVLLLLAGLAVLSVRGKCSTVCFLSRHLHPFFYVFHQGGWVVIALLFQLLLLLIKKITK
jgi:hypothetical protein